MIGRPAETLLGKLFIVDVLDRAVPADKGAVLSKPGRGPGAEPAIAPVGKAQTVRDIDRTAADYSIRPVLCCDGDIVRVLAVVRGAGVQNVGLVAADESTP